jgi:DNA-binding NarL/FixJ family response regulator
VKKHPNSGDTKMFKILIVEDSPILRQLLKYNLKELFPSMVIEEATEGVEAVQKVDILCPDLIFMDILLPGENGLELTRKIKFKYPDVRVAILTSADISEYREAAKQYGANYFMAKDSTTIEKIRDLVTSISSELVNPA